MEQEQKTENIWIICFLIGAPECSRKERVWYSVSTAPIGEGSLGIRLILSLFLFSLFNAVGNTIAVSYTEEHCLSTLKSATLSHRGLQGQYPSSTSSDRGLKILPSTEVVFLCPSLGDFNTVTEWNEIWSDVCSSAFLLCPLTIYKGVSTHGPVWLNDIWSVPLSEKMWFIALAYIYIISLRKSLQLS